MKIRRKDNRDEELIRKAEQGDVSAQYSVGFLYDRGLGGFEQDYKKAIEWYEKAAEQGNTSAQMSIGVMYKIGNGVEQDYKKAIEWFERAADQGEILSMLHLGEMYEERKDYKKAIEWLEKAAENGMSELFDLEKKIERIKSKITKKHI